MVSIIVIENGGSTETLKDIVKTAMEVHGTETFLVANAPLPEVWQTRNYIAMSHSSPNSCIQNAINKARYDLILFIDSKASTSLDQLTQMIAAMSSNWILFTYAEVQSANESLKCQIFLQRIWFQQSPQLPLACSNGWHVKEDAPINGRDEWQLDNRNYSPDDGKGCRAGRGNCISSIHFGNRRRSCSFSSNFRESTARRLNTAVNSCNIERFHRSVVKP